MIMMAVGAVFSVAVPILLGRWLVKKYNANVGPILVGAGVFVVFALILEPIVHNLVLKGTLGATIKGNIWYYALYGGLAAGIFEETGRFLGMKFLMKKEAPTAVPAVAYGVGHGGAEMILVYGMTMLANIVVSVMINAGQADVFFASVPREGDAQAQIQAQLTQLETAGIGTYLLGLWERLSALILQLGLSVMVWAAVRKGGIWLWLFPAAILLHFVVDGITVVLAKSASMVAVESIIFCCALAVGAIGWMIAKKLR